MIFKKSVVFVFHFFVLGNPQNSIEILVWKKSTKISKNCLNLSQKSTKNREKTKKNQQTLPTLTPKADLFEASVFRSKKRTKNDEKRASSD